MEDSECSAGFSGIAFTGDPGTEFTGVGGNGFTGVEDDGMFAGFFIGVTGGASETSVRCDENSLTSPSSSAACRRKDIQRSDKF